MNGDKDKSDMIDKDLYEDIDEEELIEIFDENRQEVKDDDVEEKKTKRPFPKWAFWLIAGSLFLNVIAILPQTFSIPAIEFLITSTKLSADSSISTYKKAVVVVEAGDSKGTGFSITSDGVILTNNHVIDEEEQISISFPDEGLFAAEVIESYPAIDLAVLQVEAKDLPYLELAEDVDFEVEEKINFIGNPLRFNGIANQGNIIGYTNLESWDQEVLMLKAPVYRGNSGSPVINSQGKVIGVIFATMNHEQHGKVGLAVPIDYYKNIEKE
ncbi:S1C family serine protease [Paraliobacillus sp. X-1268]|uniref:S1C family serine protease n=1 Tax=Paraliobacillus sp. X-1268 TaxID=2213193 RepID=UPI001E606A3E|nr:serine protease [Paraliobacillus sp. X-1268]